MRIRAEVVALRRVPIQIFHRIGSTDYGLGFERFNFIFNAGLDRHYAENVFLERESDRPVLAEDPHPSDAGIREFLSGNFCRCGGYTLILNAVRELAGRPVTPPA